MQGGGYESSDKLTKTNFALYINHACIQKLFQPVCIYQNSPWLNKIRNGKIWLLNGLCSPLNGLFLPFSAKTYIAK